MATYNVHAGHSLICRGAKSILDEVNEDRKVKDVVVNGLKAAGHTVYDCTDDAGKDKYSNLSAIVAKCNAHAADLDISIHLNSARNDLIGDGSTGGVEVWGYNNGTKDIGSKICAEIASALGVTNRGFKVNPEFYVLRNTKAPAIIIECVFVDDKDDADHWNAEKCGNAILKALGVENKVVEQPKPEVVNTPAPASAPTSAIKAGNVVKVAAGATYYTGQKVPAWVTKMNWIVDEVKGDRAVINKSTDGTRSINSPINVKFLTIVNGAANTSSVSAFKAYTVKVTTAALNIRKGAGMNFGVTGCIRDRGVYTIVAESAGSGSDKGWGKLKSGAGWISLDFVKKV